MARRRTVTELETLGVALIGSGAVTVLVTWLTTRKQTAATTTQLLVATSTELITPLRDEIRALRAEVERLRDETELCHRERDADRARLAVLEVELARHKAGPSATYDTPEEGPHE